MFVVDVNASAIEPTVEELRALAGDAIGFCVDVTKRSDLVSLMEKIVEQHDRIDVLVNNAGMTRYRPFQTMSDEDWDLVLALDLEAVFSVSRQRRRT